MNNKAKEQLIQRHEPPDQPLVGQGHLAKVNPATNAKSCLPAFCCQAWLDFSFFMFPNCQQTWPRTGEATS